MARLKLTVQTITLLVTYCLVCSDPRALSLHPAELPTRAVHATAAAVDNSRPLGALSKEQIASVIRAATPMLNSNCWAPLVRESAGQDAIEGRVLAQLAIDASGRVSDVDVCESSAAQPGLVQCLTEGLLSLGFADGTRGTQVSVPLVFSGAGEDQRLRPSEGASSASALAREPRDQRADLALQQRDRFARRSAVEIVDVPKFH